MSWKNWECQIKDRTGSTITWLCENTETGNTEEITSKLLEEKVFPEEDYEYSGEINGKDVEGFAETGRAAMTSINATDSNTELTDLEKSVGFAHVNWYF